MWNTRSLVSKISHLQSFIYSSDFSIFCFTETWLSNSIFDHEVFPSGFTVYRKDRNTRGGGVLIAVKNILPTKLIPSPSSLEIITISIDVKHPLILCVVYVSPNSYDCYYRHLNEYLTFLSQNYTSIIIVGDFNMPDIDWSSLNASNHHSSNFCELIFDLNFSQLVDSSTHCKGNILDLVLTNTQEIIYNLSIIPEQLQPFPSDHFIISFSIDTSTTYFPKETPKYVLDYSKADFDGLCDFLINSDFQPCLTSTNIEFVWSYIKNTVLHATFLFIPKVRLRTRQRPKWINSSLQHLINCVRSLKRKHKSRPTPLTLNKIKLCEQTLSQRLVLAKHEYESNLISKFALSSNSKIYQYLHSITRKCSIPPRICLNNTIATSDKGKASLFNCYFFQYFPLASSSSHPSTIYQLLNCVLII